MLHYLAIRIILNGAFARHHRDLKKAFLMPRAGPPNRIQDCFLPFRVQDRWKYGQVPYLRAFQPCPMAKQGAIFHMRILDACAE